MMDEEIRQALTEVQEMKKMCGNINMKLTNIVTQRGQNWKEKLEAEYHRGLEDAWEAARKLFSSMADSDIEKAFPTEWNNGGFHALINLQPQEAIEKLKAYEEKQQTDDEIKVGDEVEISQSDENGVWVVIKVEKHDDYEAYCAINKDGDIYFEEEQDRVTKTGRHFDIASILKEMQND